MGLISVFCLFVSCSFFRLQGYIHSFRSFLEGLTLKLHQKSHPGLILFPNRTAQQRRCLHHPTPTVPSVQRELFLLFPWHRDQQEGNWPEMGFSFPHSREQTKPQRDPQKFGLYHIHVVLSPRNLHVRERNLWVFFSPSLYSEIQPGIKTLCTWKHNTEL